MVIHRFWLLLVTFSLTATALMAQTTNWTGTSSTDWNTPGNWDNGVPTATLDVVISSTAIVQPTISTTATAKSVVINAGASLSITAAGSLSLNGSTATALTNSGRLTNAGSLLIGSVSAVSGFGISNAASGTITNRLGGTIQIDQTGSTGIITAGLITNAAIISIGSLTTVNGLGISNSGSFTNSSGGNITINRTGQGVANNGTFVNSSTLTIGDIALSGQDNILNDGLFTNTATGELRLDRATGNGIWHNTGSFTNDGKIVIGSVARSSATGILVYAPFQNNAGATIHIASKSTGIPITSTFVNSATITISVTPAPGFSYGYAIELKNTASFSNNAPGLIQIDDNIGTAIFTAGLFTNASTISIGSVTMVNQQGINNSGTFTNAPGGNININRTGINLGPTGDGIDNSGTFVNSSTLTIGDVAFTALDNINNTGSFTNTATGEIRLDRAAGNGLWNRPNATFQNDGKIYVGSVANMDVGIRCDGSSFVNNAGAEIHIDRVNTGMINERDFTNAGLIRIGATIPPFLLSILNIRTIPTDPVPVFTNLACGVIEVFAPVSNQEGTFTNNGLLTVNTPQGYRETRVRVNSPAALAGTYAYGIAQFGPLIGSINLTADAVLVNDGTSNATFGCNPPINAAQLAGKIALVDRGTCNFSQKVYYAQQAGAIAVVVLNNQGGNPSNMAAGLFADQVTIPTVMLSQADGQAIKAALANGPVNIGINQEPVTLPAAALTNNGIISYPQGNPIANVTNNDVIVSPISACSATFAPALQIGGANRFSVGTTWYNDQALTQPAGTYNQATNTFTATNLAVGSSRTMYFAATDNTNGCTRTVSVSVTSNSGTPTSIESLSVSGTLGSPVCRVELVGRATGASFVFTDAQGYVFSNVYRSAGTYNVVGRAVTRPGVYTLTVNNTNECGNSSSVSRTVTVGGSQCP